MAGHHSKRGVAHRGACRYSVFRARRGGLQQLFVDARGGRKLRQRQCVRQADGHGQRGLRLLAAVPEFQDRLARVHQRARGTRSPAAAAPPANWSRTSRPARSAPNVFEAVGGDNITPLQPKFTKWYVQYAGTSIVVAYNPNGPHAAEFKAIADGSKPLCSLFSNTLQTSGLQARPHRPEHRPAGPRLHHDAGAGPVLLPPARGHGGQDPGHLGLRRRLLLADLSPSPRWTRRCRPASSTPPAPSSPRRWS